jgi:uncharacterized membrane protein/heme-degrading monooxygenase HmoA
MIFLVVLVISTAGVAGVLRKQRRPRTVARCGLGVALVVTGISHFVNPTPFQQHLPTWVPAADAWVIASGLAEICLGLALIARWPNLSSVGWAAAGFLVAVFPANLYVAVAGVKVDGQPGGLYPWVRLPFQLLFVIWALWSTNLLWPGARLAAASKRSLRPVGGRADVGTPVMITVPWTSTKATQPAMVVQISRLELRRSRDIPGFLIAALRLRRATLRTPGAVGVSLRAALLSRTFWTLSAWTNHEAIAEFVTSDAHIEAMVKYRNQLARSHFHTWNAADHPTNKPSWADAHRRYETEQESP